MDSEFDNLSFPGAELYDDLYGKKQRGPKLPFQSFGPPSRGLSKNLGIPANEFLKVENINNRYDSYQYSIKTATESKAAAAATLRSKNFDTALQLAITPGPELTPAEKTKLLLEEKEFLEAGLRELQEMSALQTQLTKATIDAQMDNLGVEIGEVDPQGVNATDASNKTETGGIFSRLPKPFSSSKKSSTDEILTELNKVQKTLTKLEMEFVEGVIEIMGPERANGLRAALVGDAANRGVGGLLTQLQERPLSALLSDEGTRKSLFVVRFPGDVRASQVEMLREEVTAIIRNSKPGDEALMVLESGGGTVTGYGLAAGQLLRFKEAGMKLTICVEQVAASGGYMMCCVADRIVASPMAVLGSIGVITEIPNVYQRLKDEGM